MTVQMNFKVISIAFVVIALLFTGCFRLSTQLYEKLADDKKEAIAQAYVQKLKDGRLNELAGELQPLLKIDLGTVIGKLDHARSFIPSGEPHQIDLVGFNINYLNGETRNQFVYQYGYAERWIVATVTWRELPNDGTQLQGIFINALPGPLQEINAFTFRGKTLRHYVFGILAVVIPVFSLTTLIVCIRTKFTGRKWPWILFILAGLGGLSLNWTTGQIGFTVLKITLLGSTALTAGAYAPWVLTLSLPLGAICFWLRRKPQPPPIPSRFDYPMPK